MKKKELIDETTKYRSKLNKLINLILEKGDLKTLVSSTWRAKDIIAHISWHEFEMENLLRTMNLEGSPYWGLPTDERNDKIFEDCFDYDDNKVLLEYEKSYIQMMEHLKNIPENSLTDPSMYQNMPNEWQPWKIIAGNTFEHYVDHIKQLKNRFEYL